MIRISKPEQAPDILLSTGKARRATLCALYSRYSQDYETGVRKFSFDSSIYGHESVKRALVEVQHSKCCFCESKIGFDGDVEHFRPKAGCCQGEGNPLLRPGYYWLAYEWDNLLLSCPGCNQRFKRNYFPLLDPGLRVRSHKVDIAQEQPLFINPAKQDPEQHIAFRMEIPYAIDDNPFGMATISALGLDRAILNERRRDRLAHLTALRRIVALEAGEPDIEMQQVIDESKALLIDAVNDSAEFAAMSRCAAQSDFYI